MQIIPQGRKLQGPQWMTCPELCGRREEEAEKFHEAKSPPRTQGTYQGSRREVYQLH